MTNAVPNHDVPSRAGRAAPRAPRPSRAGRPARRGTGGEGRATKGGSGAWGDRRGGEWGGAGRSARAARGGGGSDVAASCAAARRSPSLPSFLRRGRQAEIMRATERVSRQEPSRQAAKLVAVTPPRRACHACHRSPSRGPPLPSHSAAAAAEEPSVVVRAPPRPPRCVFCVCATRGWRPRFCALRDDDDDDDDDACFTHRGDLQAATASLDQRRPQTATGD